MRLPHAREWQVALLAALALTALVLAYRASDISNPTIVALSLLTIILAVAATSTRRLSVLTSIAAMLLFNYFFLPPVGTLTISDPQNWVALFVFLAVSLVASSLSAAVRARASEAVARRDELARLFDLTRDVLMTTDSRDAIPALARYISRRFDLDPVNIYLPSPDGAWRSYRGGIVTLDVGPDVLQQALVGSERHIEFDARERTYSG